MEPHWKAYKKFREIQKANRITFLHATNNQKSKYLSEKKNLN